jgi:hypothetical protein
MHPYQQQLARVERFLQRILAPTTDRKEYEDFLWAFFQNCWHLRDWIKNDTSIRKRKRDVILPIIHKSKILAICQCLANRSKHYRLDGRSPRHAKMVGGISLTIEDSQSAEDAVTSSVDYIIRVGKKTRPALPFAQDAVSEWRNILHENRL